MFNRLIFPAPSPSYGTGSLQGELIHIPRNRAEPPKIAQVEQNQNQNEDIDKTSPSPLLSVRLAPAFFDFTCGIFIRGSSTAKHVLMYSHPNAVDIGHMRGELAAMARICNLHVLLVEFQGYGLLQSSSPSEQQATEDGFAGFNFITKTLGFPANKVIMMGRSIGTGVTCNVAAQLQEPDRIPLAVLLECPFTSIKACVKSLAGKNFGSFASDMVGERFPNLKNVPKIKCPVTIIHGTQDQICPFEGSVELCRTAQESGKSDTVLIQLDCDHNDIPAEPAFAWAKELVMKNSSSSTSASSTSPTDQLLLERLRPYFSGPWVFHDIQQGRSRPMPLTKSPSSTLPGSTAISRSASSLITSPFSHLSQALCYNMFSFLSLARTSWELYQMCRDEALSHASGSEQVMQYLNMLAPSVLTNAVSSFRDKSTQLADGWKMSEYVELCAYLWGHPLSLGILQNNKSQNINQKLIFGSVPENKTEDISSSVEKKIIFSSGETVSTISHYDSIWGQMSHTLRNTHLEIQKYAEKVRIEQEEFEKKQQQQVEIEEKKVEESSSEKSSLVVSSSLTSATSTSTTSRVPFKSSLPPFNTASTISQHSLRSENFSPSVFWIFPPTMLKIFCDNLEKSKRSAAETMRRIEEKFNENGGIPLKPQPVTEKGSQWVQVEMERFVISNLVENNNKNNNNSVFDLIEGEFSRSVEQQNQQQEENSVQKWKEELKSLLHGPFLDGVLIPLPIAVDSSEAMKELLQLYRRAPPSLCIQPAVLDLGAKNVVVGNASGGTKSSQAADCVIQ